jgi:hypothetical protein
MPPIRPRRLPKPGRRRALTPLAGCGQQGCTEALMLAQGFTVEFLAELVREGLASATAERAAMGAREIEVARVRITEEGRRALEPAKR